MVNNQESLDQVFSALGSTTRRQILTRLQQSGDQSVSELATPLGVKLPSMLKQLDVLEQARLITREKTGRIVNVRLAPWPLAKANAWLARYEQFWAPRLDRLARLAEDSARKARP